MPERRHRLHNHEIPEVVAGLKLRLEQHIEKKEDKDSAEIAFQDLFRFIYGNPGRPKYPTFSWDRLQGFLEYHFE